MLNFTSEELTAKLKKVQKAFGKTGLKDSNITINSDPNGVNAIIKYSEGFLQFSADAEIKEEGSITLSLEDLMDLLYDKTFELDNNEVNGIPVIPVADSVEHHNLIGARIILTDNDMAKVLKQIKSDKKNLKKSLFYESSFLKLMFDNQKLTTQHLNPFRLQNNELELESVNPTAATLFLDKLNLKIIQSIFNQGEVAIIRNSDTAIIGNDFELIINPDYTINEKLYQPTYRKKVEF